MDTVIRMPFLERRKDNLHLQKPVQPNGATQWPARSFVKLSSGVLIAVATDDQVCYGWCPEPSFLTTDKPPSTLYGVNHWPHDLNGSQFIVNITNTAQNIGQAAGAPQLSAVAIGSSYGLTRRSSDGMQFLNVSQTTAGNVFFKVIALYPGQSVTDYNGLVLVEIVAAAIQAGV